MSSCNNGNSWIENAFLMAMVILFLTYVFLAIPILPYLDIVLKLILFIHTPDSFGGYLITGLILIFAGFFMLEAAKEIGRWKFNNTVAMYLFLYGQGLLMISLLYSADSIFYISKVLVAFVSAMFNEQPESVKHYFTIAGIILVAIGIIAESGDDQKNPTNSKGHRATPSSRVTDKVVMRNRLKVIDQANKILKKNKESLSQYEKGILSKADRYREYFTEEELGDIPAALQKYLQ